MQKTKTGLIKYGNSGEHWEGQIKFSSHIDPETKASYIEISWSDPPELMEQLFRGVNTVIFKETYGPETHGVTAPGNRRINYTPREVDLTKVKALRDQYRRNRPQKETEGQG